MAAVANAVARVAGGGAWRDGATLPPGPATQPAAAARAEALRARLAHAEAVGAPGSVLEAARAALARVDDLLSRAPADGTGPSSGSSSDREDGDGGLEDDGHPFVISLTELAAAAARRGRRPATPQSLKKGKGRLAGHASSPTPLAGCTGGACRSLGSPALLARLRETYAGPVAPCKCTGACGRPPSARAADVLDALDDVVAGPGGAEGPVLLG